jgi:3-hydroxyacyl-CoA dehydrogenase / 3-hydroxy-2-methylbutyryl-CoA dehydrogenase
MNVSDAVIVVTGGASGLGEATCRYMLELGAQGVTILDVSRERGAELALELGERCLFMPSDITDEAAVQEAIEATEARFGAVHVVVAAAGIVGPSKLLTRSGLISMERFEAVMRVNLYGTLHVIRSAAASMRKNEPDADGERGVLIMVASSAAYEGQIGQVAYSASKGALVGMTLPLARELAEYGIRVMTIAPGAFDTPIYETIPAAVREGVVDVQLFPKRLGRPAEFALLVEEIIRNPVHNGRTYRFDGGAILPPR